MHNQTEKKSREQLDSESDNGQSTSSFNRFLIIESSKLDQHLPFVIEKVFVSVAGSPTFVKTLNSGSLLLEVEKAKHAKNLLKLTRFFEIPSKCYPHTSLNTSKEIIRCPEVTAARRVTVFRDNVKRNTNIIVLTFNTSNIPKLLKVGYWKVLVDMYILNPLQCWACFKYAYHDRSCKLHEGDELCRRCGITGINRDKTKCTNEIKSDNCGKAHISTCKYCKIWKNEKEVVTIKFREGLSFPEARKKIEKRYNLSF